MTRRTLLQVSGLAPFVALAASGASPAQALETCKEVHDTYPIPDGTMQQLVKWANERAEEKQKKLDVVKLEKVARMLWCYFVLGADPTQIENVDAVVRAGYETKNDDGTRCGDLVVDQLHEWDEHGHHPATDYCAYRCGVNAANIADDETPEGNPKIDKARYEQAFNQTEREVHSMMVRLRSLQQKRGQGPPKTRGLGC